HRDLHLCDRRQRQMCIRDRAHPQRWRVSGAAAGAHPQRWRVSGAAAGAHPQRWRVNRVLLV
ncbi:hypothetical protein ELO12_26365, partial [Klebsiella pneumoniae]|nr:hypothetical protein [Klebsiella pneumoniae]